MRNFHRRSIRLAGYDYSEAGSYFVTLVTHQRQYLFGQVVDEKMHLSAEGKILWGIWESLPERYPSIEIDCAVVMPNHFHCILTINCQD